MSMSWSYLLWTVTIQLLTTLSRLGHTALRALSHYGPLCRAKWQSYSFLLYLKLYLSGMRIQKLQSTSLPVRSENITYHINKQEMSQPLAILASKCDWGLPKLWFSKCCQPLQGDCWWNAGSKVNKEPDLATKSMWKEWISVSPEACFFPCTEW